MPNLSLHVDLKQLETVREFVAETCQELGLDCRAAYDVQLAVDEACANVFQHAYSQQGGRVEIAIYAIDCGLRVVIRDWGARFDPLAVPAPDVAAPLEERPLGGLGLYLMRRTMDEVEFQFDEDEGNTLTMVKRTGC